MHYSVSSHAILNTDILTSKKLIKAHISPILYHPTRHLCSIVNYEQMIVFQMIMKRKVSTAHQLYAFASNETLLNYLFISLSPSYDITVETGFRTGAGTTARVSIVLHGDEGHSETKELTCDDKPIFERNSRDRFITR